jgi:methyltransferase (TIGR00027 family)
MTMIRTVQTVVFLVLQLAMLPLSIGGYLYAVVKTVRYGKQHGTSVTATSILGGRWIMHVFGTREDEATFKITGTLPFMSSAANYVMFLPAILAHRLTGYIPGMAKSVPPEKASITTLVSSRTPIFDEIIERNLGEMEQMVVLGAGYDTRTFKYGKNLDVSAFELDQPETQNSKLEALKAAGLETEGITFIPVNFNHESWADKLADSSFDPAKRTLWLWEGVTLYLDEEIVKKTLKDILGLSASGSHIAFDFYSKAFVSFEGSALLRIAGKQMLKAAGEPLKYGIDTKTDAQHNVETLLHETGYALESLTLLGKNTAKNNPFAGIVEAVVK